MNRIRLLRTMKKMTQREVGQVLDVGNTAISMYENDSRSIDDKTIRKLCALFGCSADYLLGLSDYRPRVTDEDARRLEAYHSADKEDRKAIDKMLRKACRK